MYNKGLIKTILVIIVILIVLGYFGFNVPNIINSPTVQANLQGAWNLVVTIWNNYLAAPVAFIFEWLWKLVQAGFSGAK